MKHAARNGIRIVGACMVVAMLAGCSTDNNPSKPDTRTLPRGEPGTPPASCSDYGLVLVASYDYQGVNLILCATPPPSGFTWVTGGSPPVIVGWSGPNGTNGTF